MKTSKTGLKILGVLVSIGLVLGAAQIAAAAIIPTTVPASPADGNHLVAWYPLTGDDSSGSQYGVFDNSGNGFNGSFTGSADNSNLTTGTCFNGVNQFISLPDAVTSGLQSMTVTVDVQNASLFNNYVFGFGNSQPGYGGQVPDGYMYLRSGANIQAGISLSDQNSEQTTYEFDGTPHQNVWQRVTYTYDAGTQTATLYRNGNRVAQSQQTISPSQIPAVGADIGMVSPLYEQTQMFYGCMKDFRIYNDALTAAEVSGIDSNDAAAQTDAANLTVQDLNDVRGDLYLPTSLADGANVTWASSNPAVIDSTGLVNRPATNTSVTLIATVNLSGGLAQQQFTANVIAAPTTVINGQTLAGYAFTYFTGDTKAGENLYVAVSNGDDILHYSPVNGGKPILVSHFGTGGLRDPSLIRSPDGDTFYLIATDLSIGGGTTWGASVSTGSQYIEVWKSHNLVDWTQQAHTLVSLPTAGNTWAPDAIWDPTLNEYVVYWASQNYLQSDPGHLQVANNYNRMMYSTTRDFVNFTSPVVWQDPGASRLDGAVIYKAATQTYYRFTKDEGNTIPKTGCSDILEESSTNLLTPTTSNSEGRSEEHTSELQSPA